jgi:hypothetical protein
MIVELVSILAHLSVTFQLMMMPLHFSMMFPPSL